MPTFYGAIDLVKNEIRNAVVQNLGAAPSSPSKGQFYFNSTDNTLYWYDGAQWIAAKAAAGATPAGTVSTAAIGDAGVVGVSTNFAREDHKHGMPAFGGVAAINSYGVPSDPGVATTLSRADHNHGSVSHDQLNLLTAPTGAVNMNNQRIISVADPTNFADAANKNYVDNSIAGLAWKDSVRAATTVTGTLATAYANGQVIDGVTLATGNRILIKNQTTASENGIYTVTAGAPTRATDADTGAEMLQATVFVEEGSTLSETVWVCNVNGTITLGSTALVFVQFGAANSYTAGNGLTLTGNVIDVVPADTTLTVNADSMQVNTSVMATQAFVNALVAAYASKLTPTATKTGNYTLAPGELAIFDLTSGNMTGTLPSAPPDGTEVGILIKATGSGASTLTIARGGTDTIVGGLGGTSAYMYGAGSSVRLRYQASSTSWLPAHAIYAPNVPLNIFAAPFNSVQMGLQKIAALGDATTGTDAMNRQASDARYPQLSTLTTKGDIYVATGAGVLVRVGVGPDGYALLGDASQAAGVRWGLPSPVGAVVKYATTLVGTSSPEVITHNLNTRDVHVTVYNGATPYTAIEVDWDATSVNTVTVRYNPNLGAGYRVVVMG